MTIIVYRSQIQKLLQHANPSYCATRIPIPCQTPRSDPLKSYYIPRESNQRRSPVLS